MAKVKDEDGTPAVMTVEEVARLMGIKPASVEWYLSQKPEMVPPRAEWTHRRLFERAVVKDWMKARSGANELKKRLASKPEPVENFERPPRVVRNGRPRRQV
jgi:predicted transcriptional regulator